MDEPAEASVSDDLEEPVLYAQANSSSNQARSSHSDTQAKMRCTHRTWTGSSWAWACRVPTPTASESSSRPRPCPTARRPPYGHGSADVRRCTLVFFPAQANSSDPAGQSGARCHRDAIDAKRAELGIDQPLLSQYGDWLVDAVQDLGTNWFTGEEITTELADRIPVTLGLAFGGLLLAVVIGCSSACSQR